MNLDSKQFQEFVGLIQSLYNQIYLEKDSEKSPYSYSYRHLYDGDSWLTLDLEAYDQFVTALFELPSISDLWSKRGMQTRIAELLNNLATKKFNPSDKVVLNFSDTTRSWFEKIETHFDARECYVPIIGLTLDKPLEIGNVTFWPLEMKRAFLHQHKFGDAFFDGLLSNRDCIASSIVRTEELKSAEAIRTRADNALNVMRYIAGLEFREPPSLYVGGHERTHISTALSLSLNKNKNIVAGYSGYTGPLQVDDNFIRIARFYGLEYLQSLIKKQEKSQIEENLLLAIHWFGDASQDIYPLSAFVKFYIPFEIIAKRKTETRDVDKIISKRISVLIESHDRAKQRHLEDELKIIVHERNAVFHSGKPELRGTEYLQNVCRKTSGKAIHELIERIQLNSLGTTEDFINWVDSHYKKWLS